MNDRYQIKFQRLVDAMFGGVRLKEEKRIIKSNHGKRRSEINII
jgi:hypothetical protein